MGGKNEKRIRRAYENISHKGHGGIGLDRVRTVKDVKDAANLAAVEKDFRDLEKVGLFERAKEFADDPTPEEFYGVVPDPTLPRKEKK